jgi:hypothetical protein
MRYFLWIDSKQSGPFEAPKIIEMLDAHQITPDTLAHPEGDTGNWIEIRRFYSEIFESQKPQPPVLPVEQTPSKQIVLPPVEESRVSLALTVIAVLEFIGAPIAGLGVGSDDTFAGWIVFLTGVISGLIFLGFARVIQNTFDSSQRLRRLEILMERSYDEKRAA